MCLTEKIHKAEKDYDILFTETEPLAKTGLIKIICILKCGEQKLMVLNSKETINYGVE